MLDRSFPLFPRGQRECPKERASSCWEDDGCPRTRQIPNSLFFALFLSMGFFFNMKIYFLHVSFTHVHNPKDLLCSWQGHPVASFKVICSTATSPVPGPAHLIRTLPWPTAQPWQPFSPSPSLWNRLEAKGILQAVEVAS